MNVKQKYGLTNYQIAEEIDGLKDYDFYEIILEIGKMNGARNVAETINWLKEVMEEIEEQKEERTVTEFCPSCEAEIQMTWNIAQRGYQAYCPVCGERLMLCDECRHSTLNADCDYNAVADRCGRMGRR